MRIRKGDYTRKNFDHDSDKELEEINEMLEDKEYNQEKSKIDRMSLI